MSRRNVKLLLAALGVLLLVTSVANADTKHWKTNDQEGTKSDQYYNSHGYFVSDLRESSHSIKEPTVVWHSYRHVSYFGDLQPAAGHRRERPLRMDAATSESATTTQETKISWLRFVNQYTESCSQTYFKKTGELLIQNYRKTFDEKGNATGGEAIETSSSHDLCRWHNRGFRTCYSVYSAAKGAFEGVEQSFPDPTRCKDPKFPFDLLVS
ncbi:MAG: hypothetical protein ACRENA_17130 [Vulcanimicrobiaceae bacterium]